MAKNVVLKDADGNELNLLNESGTSGAIYINVEYVDGELQIDENFNQTILQLIEEDSLKNTIIKVFSNTDSTNDVYNLKFSSSTFPTNFDGEYAYLIWDCKEVFIEIEIEYFENAVRSITATLYFKKDSDTKNTAGASQDTSKLYLVGAKYQATAPQTYSNNKVYISGNEVYSGGYKTLNSNNTKFTKITETGARIGNLTIDGKTTPLFSGTSSKTIFVEASDRNESIFQNYYEDNIFARYRIYVSIEDLEEYIEDTGLTLYFGTDVTGKRREFLLLTMVDAGSGYYKPEWYYCVEVSLLKVFGLGTIVHIKRPHDKLSKANFIEEIEGLGSGSNYTLSDEESFIIPNNQADGNPVSLDLDCLDYGHMNICIQVLEEY